MALHAAIAAELITNHDAVIAKAKTNLARMRRDTRSLPALKWLDEWEQLLDGPTENIAALTFSDTEHAHDMRQMAPFAGVLSSTIRLAAIKDASREPLSA